MTSTIDDAIDGKKKSPESIHNAGRNSGGISLESRISSAGKTLKSVGSAIFTGGILAGTYGLVGRSSLLTAAGNAAGYIIEKAKGKNRGEKLKDEVKEGKMHSEIRTGGILGAIGYALYSMIDFIPNYSIPLKIAKTLAFNPIMLAPYVAFYQAFTYLRDKVGTGKSIAGFFNFKIFRYLKDAYYSEIKPNFRGSMKKIMYLMPIHFASINYVSEVWKRVGIGVFNDIAFRLFQSNKKEKQEYSSANYNHGRMNPQTAYG